MINVVLYEPEIPQNTGNIMRTCMAFHCRLHLIEPLGFYLDEAHLRRAGMDYRDKIEMHTYKNWNEFLEKNQGHFDYTKCENDIYLVFGKESTGIPKEILFNHMDRCIRIPMVKEARSLNLSNCVALCVYEVLDQLGYPDLCSTETIKGEDFLSSEVWREKK